MCKTCYCDKCNSQCYVCGNCEKPISMDTYVELEGVEEKFCNETCANSYERAQQELSMLYSAEEKRGKKMAKHLRYCMTGACYGHPQTVMKSLGIKYQHSVPQSIYDQWWFFNCENIPENLPEYLKEFKVDPIKCIGHGLSKEDAEEIRDYVSKEKQGEKDV